MEEEIINKLKNILRNNGRSSLISKSEIEEIINNYEDSKKETDKK